MLLRIAGMLADAYDVAGFSMAHIVDAIAAAADGRGVPVEAARLGHRA